MQNNNPLTKADLIQAIIMHILLLTIIIVNGYVQNKKTFLDLKLINSSTLTKPNEPNTATAPIKASLVDHKEIQQAVKRQEKVFADKVAREKKLEQQEQKIAKLTALSEQTAKKTKEEQDTLKKEKEALKKEQENLQKTANKIKQQQQE